MNLITCAQNCAYQKDGYCRLTGAAPVSAAPVAGCSYFQKRPDRETPPVPSLSQRKES